MLLHVEYARADCGGWDTVHKWAAAMTRGPIDAHPDACGLYRGAPAIAFALRVAEQPAFDAALFTLDSHIATLTRYRLERAHKRIDRGQLPRLREFDLVSGLTGLGAYLLHQQAMGKLLREVLSYLVRLVEPLTVDGETLPGWWTNHGPNDQPSTLWPGGHGNLGMAHGIAGPLALLAITMRRGITVAGHSEAIEGIYNWLDQWRCGSPSRTWWPGLISRHEWQTRAVQQPGPQRPSWCYGTPGLARAQQLAALAMANQRRQRHAETTLATCIAEDAQLSQLRDASLCHGWAGLLQTTWRAAADAGTDSELATLLPHPPSGQLLTRRGSLADWASHAEWLATRVAHPVSRWRPAIAAIPRHLFVPRTALIVTADKTDNGGAVGRTEWDRAGFMPTRAGPDYPPGLSDTFSTIRDAEGDQISIGRYPVVNVVEAWELWSMLGIVAPGIEHHYQLDDDGRRTAWMLHPDGSWARATSADGEAPTVHQSGPRRLWDIMDDLRHFWLRDGSLPIYGATVTIAPDGACHFKRGRWQATLTR